MPIQSTELFDSHLHLTDEKFVGEVGDVLKRAREARVTRLVTVASDVSDAVAARDLAREHEIFSTAGIHPHAASTYTLSAMDTIRELLEEPEVVAVGETGLDFHYDNSPREIQRESFEAHLDLARELDRPIVVHSRSADSDMVDVLQRRGLSVRGVLHCFTGGEELFEAGLSAGWYFSFGGVVTFKSFVGGSQVRRVPWDRLMLETDSPYLAPVPMRGRRNEPAFVRHTCAVVAELRGVSFDQAAERTTESSLNFYGMT